MQALGTAGDASLAYMPQFDALWVMQVPLTPASPEAAVPMHRDSAGQEGSGGVHEEPTAAGATHFPDFVDVAPTHVADAAQSAVWFFTVPQSSPAAFTEMG